MRLALNIISYVGFGFNPLWPGETLAEGTDPKLAKYGSLTPAAGHKLSFVDTIATVLENIVLLLLMPRWLLRMSTTKAVTKLDLLTELCRTDAFQEGRTCCRLWRGL